MKTVNATAALINKAGFYTSPVIRAAVFHMWSFNASPVATKLNSSYEATPRHFFVYVYKSWTCVHRLFTSYRMIKKNIVYPSATTINHHCQRHRLRCTGLHRFALEAINGIYLLRDNRSRIHFVRVLMPRTCIISRQKIMTGSTDDINRASRVCVPY